MSDHIRICEVDDDHVIFVRFNGFHQLVADLVGAHLGLQVIGGNLGGIHQDPVLSLVGRLHAAVEEKGYMGILLRLSDSRLSHVVGSQPLSKGVGHLHLVESHFLVGDGRIIFREADILYLQPLRSVEALEIVITERMGDLSRAVRTEIIENNGIAVFNGRNRSAVLHNHGGLNKLIRFISVIGGLNTFRRAGSGQPLALRQRVISQLHTVIVIISVHRVVAAHHGSHLAYAQLLHLFLKLLHIALTARRRGVTSIQEAVYVYLL